MKKSVKGSVICLLVTGLLFASVIGQAEDALDMTGSWKISLFSPLRKLVAGLDLEQKGDQLTGTYHGKKDVPVQGTIKGNEFQINFTTSGVSADCKGKAETTKFEGECDLGSYGYADLSGEKKLP